MSTNETDEAPDEVMEEIKRDLDEWQNEYIEATIEHVRDQD